MDLLLGGSLIVIPLVFLVFLLGRELFCWYFKQTEIVSLLKDILEKLASESQTGSSGNTYLA